MMVIHDMENSLEIIRNMAVDEEECRNVAMDVLSRIDELDSISQDTKKSIPLLLEPYLSTGRATRLS